jgi:hypothetical protein
VEDDRHAYGSEVFIGIGAEVSLIRVDKKYSAISAWMHGHGSEH